MGGTHYVYAVNEYVVQIIFFTYLRRLQNIDGLHISKNKDQYL